MSDLVFSVSDFVAVFNQTLEFAYPSVSIQGELANFRVSKNKWVYFDLKDDFSSVKFFGTVFNLPGPLEDGLLLEVVGRPRLHPLYGFSVNIQSMRPVGEGSIKKATAMLEAKLRAEGLFDESRRRLLPYPPERVGLIASGESAAYHDFMKILNARWGGVEIELFDSQVQGEAAVGQIVAALDHFNTHEEPAVRPRAHGRGVDILVLTRGGGSPEDLAAFGSEQVTRAVAASRIPTLVAVGHEVDVSLAELAADKRGSTPSNAAELLVPDKRSELEKLGSYRKSLLDLVRQSYESRVKNQEEARTVLEQSVAAIFERQKLELAQKKRIMEALSPSAVLERGYAVLRTSGKVVKSVKSVKPGQEVKISLQDGSLSATIDKL